MGVEKPLKGEIVVSFTGLGAARGARGPLRPGLRGAYGDAKAKDRGEPMDIRKVGVVGAGQMGNGIAHVLAHSGYDVLLTDITQEALDKGVGNIRKNMERQVGRGKMEEAVMEAALGRITTTLALKDLGQTDLVIESATERETCLLYTSPSPRDLSTSRMPSSA